METLILILVVVTLIIILGMNGRVREILQRSENLQREITRLREDLNSHVSSTDFGTSTPPDYTPTPFFTDPGTENVEDEADLSEPDDDPWIVSEELLQEESPAAESPNHDNTDRPASPRNWEKLIGINLFSKIGILVFVIGIGFFVKYAIDQNWINEFTRTLLAMGIGVCLWGLAYPLRDKYRNFSSILAGGGFAICFVSVAIGYHLYGIFGSTASFIIMITLTSVMTAIALLFDRMELAITAIIGGFAAPFIASDGSGAFISVLAYMAILNSAVLAISIYRNWWILAPIACWLTYIITGIGISVTETSQHNGWWLGAISYYFVVFSIPLITDIRRNITHSTVIAALISAILLNNLAYLCFGTWIMAGISQGYNAKGLVALAGCCVNLGIYLRYYKDREADLINSLLITFISGMALAAVLVQFTSAGVRFTATGLYAAIMLWMSMRTGHRIYRLLAMLTGVPQTIVLLGGAALGADDFFGGRNAIWIYLVNGAAYLWCVRLILGETDAPAQSLRKTGVWMLWSGAIIICTGFVALFDYYLPPQIANGTSLIAIASVGILLTYPPFNRPSTFLILPAAAVIVFTLTPHFNVENPLMDIPMMVSIPLFGVIYFRCATAVFIHSTSDTRTIGKYMIYFNLAAILFILSAVFSVLDTTGLVVYRSAALSVTLSICASVQMIFGMRYHSKQLRVIALTVLGLVLVKLVGYDLWRMVAIGRIIVFILLGAILLTISFMYQKLRRYLSDREGQSPSNT
ncbi:MAG: DUF2339 domain-containing protein [Staphylococcus sp.]|nr:DUF2339 domain-containing protein [Staphylococcus sp.]